MPSTPIPSARDRRPLAGAPLAAQLAILLASIWAGAAPCPAQIPLPEPAQVRPQGLVTQGIGTQGGNGTQGAGATTGSGAETPRLTERSYRGTYSESQSRELFRACDGNSDDRLDVLETADAFDALRTPGDHEGYARFDVDRDGFVSWPEFDTRFRLAIADGGTFRVQACRSSVTPEPPPQPLTRLQQFLRLVDRDGDGSLDKAEIDQFLQRAKLPPTFAGLLLQTDRDGSGKVDETELAPWFEKLPISPLTLLGASTSPLPQPWFSGDGDQNGTIDKHELTGMLRRLDPGLERWSGGLFERLDRNRDQRLDRNELGIEPVPQKPERRPARNAPQR